MGDTLLPPSTDQFNLSSMSYIGHACLVTEKPAAREKQLEGMNFLFEQPESELAEVVRRAEMGSKLSVATTAKRAKVPKRKPGKKDRHSKIPTAKGLRDRRMRLSLDVARKFFKLQDLLGYDKASKTVKWLMDNAQLAIKHLARSTSLPAARVPSEVESQMVTDWKGSSKQAGCDTTEDHTKAGEGKGGEERCLPPSQKTTVGTLRRAISLPAARESREKARARARERTNEKKLKRRLEETVNQEEGIRSKTICSLSELVAQLPEISCHSQENEHSASIDDMTHDSFRSLFDHNENYGLFLNDQNHDAGDGRIGWTDELIADWDSDEITLSSASFSLLDMHSPVQLTDLQSFPKPWEFNPY